MSRKDEVAIVGYAARVPGATNIDSLWSILRDGRSTVTWITPDRFPTQAFYHPAPARSGRSYTFAAGLINDVWGFDAAAFGMSPREAEQVDPQQRQLLEVTHDALAHSGIRPSALMGSGTGVYVGASSVDYGARFFADPSAADVHMMTGNTMSVIANRISYNLDLHGPSLTIDTACSSSLVALSLAAESIRNGTVDTAIVGGVNLLLSPFSFIGFSRASMLSPTGRCRPFDAAADGYVRAEGAIILVLRSLAAARKARNRIHAVIVGSGVGQDGRTTGLSLPSADSQRQLLEQVYNDFAVDPSDLTFVEAHGTGTKVGDPMEADALGKALAQKRSQPLPIGSVKSNIGHLEPASGLAGVVKSILALNYGMVPATLHQKAPNPDIPFDELNLKVIDRNWKLAEQRGPLLAGVNSFGFGGTNAHVILRGGDATVNLTRARIGGHAPPLLLTAHTADALVPLGKAYIEQWPSETRLAGEFIGAAAHTRDALPHRLLVRGTTAEEVRYHLECYVQGKAPPSVQAGQSLGTDLPVAFLFSGNGSQWAGMGREAWHGNARFRDAFKDVDDRFLKLQKWSLVEMLFADDLAPRLRRAVYSQPLLLALQIATVRTLEDTGVVPAATLGHSVGEVAAAWAAGALSLEQAIEVVIARSRHQEHARGSGGMAALMLSDREAQHFIKTVNAPGVCVAALNSWRSVTVSGPIAEIDRVLAAASDAKISARRLDVDYPFHSPLVDPVRAPLLRELQGLKSRRTQRRFVSTVTGDHADNLELDANHWWRNIRAPVQFEAAVNCLLKDGFRVFVEIGPKPILSSYVRDMLREANTRGAFIESLTESADQKSADPIEQTVSKVFLAGGRVDLERFIGPSPLTAPPLPLYPWQHANFIIQPTIEASNIFATAKHPVLGLRLRNDSAEWFSTVDPTLFPWIVDHKVGGVPVFPAAGYIDVMLAAARETYVDGALELRDLDIVHPLVFDGTASFETSLRLAHETGILEFLSRPRGSGPEWTLNARGIVSRSPATSSIATIPDEPPGTVIVPKVEIYDIASKLGFGYGPSFQRVFRAAMLNSKSAIATLEPSRDTAFAACVIDLTGLDAALHAIFASENAGVSSGPLKCMLPVRFGSVRAFVPGATAALAVVRIIRRSSRSMVAEVDLFDASGTVIVSARDIRLIDAPVAAALEPKSQYYRYEVRELDRAGAPSVVRTAASDSDKAAARMKKIEAESLSEALLLLEAGCLRLTWAAFKKTNKNNAAQTGSPSIEGEDGAYWPAFTRSALLWHLESKDLVVERQGVRVLAETCELPDVGSVVRSLIARHPTMALEAAGLSRLEGIISHVLAGDPSAPAELGSAHWRQLSAAAGQIAILRESVIADLRTMLSQCDGNRILRLLLIGADHAAFVSELATQFPALEVIVTDVDANRLEQGKVGLGEDKPHIRWVSWTDLESLPAATVDMACAIDALSEVAATRDGVGRVLRLLRPKAPIVAGELTPSLFWDIVRGVRPGWWTRSASEEFPVGALLTGEEWVDELNIAGIDAVTARPLGGQERTGVILGGSAGGLASRGEWVGAEASTFSWEGDDTPGTVALRHALGRRLAGPRGQEPHRHGNAPNEFPVATNDKPATLSEDPDVSDIVWTIDARISAADPAAALAIQLERIAIRCRQLAGKPVRLWMILDVGDVDPAASPLDRPMWCAITAAMRVVQNEYSGIQVRCIGLAGPSSTATSDQAAEEVLSPSDEREIFFAGGKRLVFRIERGSRALQALPGGVREAALTLGARNAAARSALEWLPAERPAPGPGEVLIEVAATGLNFRDVMWNLGLLPEEALEDGYAGPGFGMECAGTITGIGPDVADFSIGDRVVSFVSGGFTSHVVAPSFAVSRLPGHLTFEAAATLPVAFLTVYYALAHLGRLGSGETVLVHGAAGAVGLAALQVAKHLGAKVIATAGSEEKRALLRNLGADLVLNSRTLTFADEIAAHTGGRGVDVVLNSLTGEAMVRSMECLTPFGRFIELGKRDFYANTHLGLRPFRRNLTYFGVDIDQLIGEHKELTQRLFGELLQLFTDGDLTPLPHRVFGAPQILDAFRLMQRAGHIGKIVVTPPAEATDKSRAMGKFPVDVDGLHLVIGGTSGFGLATAEWLVERGARHVTLISRSGKPSESAIAKIDAMQRQGVTIEMEAVDVTNGAALEQFLRISASRRQIKGIVHAAMVIDDRLIDGIDRATIEKVLRPKITGALNLDRLTRDLPLDYFLLYSSATTFIGNPGQLNYVAANAFLEGLARQRRSQGLPALAVAWGAIEDAGYLSRNIADNVSLKNRFATSLLFARQALNGLDWAYDESMNQLDASCAIARIDWLMAKRELVATRAPLFNAVAPTTGLRQATDSAATIEKLRGMPLEQAISALLDIIVAEIARVLRLPAKEVERDRPLAEIGMDSLMMLELRTTVEATLNIELPMMSLANGITPADVAKRIAPLIVGGGATDTVPGNLAALATSHLAEDTESAHVDARQAAAHALIERSRRLEGPL